jgi:hypothetical protein
MQGAVRAYGYTPLHAICQQSIHHHFFTFAFSLLHFSTSPLLHSNIRCDGDKVAHAAGQDKEVPDAVGKAVLVT